MNSLDRPSVALFGASVRALAQSAKAAGFRVFACDLFNDEDLVECCGQVVQLEHRDYPNGFRLVADQWPGIPRVYTGGLENHPDVIAHFAATGSLWGCSPESLRAGRDPHALRDAGIETPDVSLSAAGVSTDGTWLLKPLHGSGGRGIQPWFGGDLPKGSFLQERIEGAPCSASFLALPDVTLLIGAASQFIGDSWTGAPSFAYAGGIAPMKLSLQTSEALQRVGERLRMRFALRGLFGVDAVRNGDAWTILEINPRPAASMELFELVGIGSMFALHCSAFTRDQSRLKTPTRFAGKAIFYAADRCHLLDRLPSREGEWTFADRPAPGAVFDAGDPVATVLGHGETPEEVADRLRSGVERLRNRLTAA